MSLENIIYGIAATLVALLVTDVRRAINRLDTKVEQIVERNRVADLELQRIKDSVNAQQPRC